MMTGAHSARRPLVGVLRRDEEDRAGSVVGDPAGHRAQQQRTEAARAAVAEHDHVGVPARVDEYFGREAVNRLDGDRLRTRFADFSQRFVGFRLGRLAGAVGLEPGLLDC